MAEDKDKEVSSAEEVSEEEAEEEVPATKRSKKAEASSEEEIPSEDEDDEPPKRTKKKADSDEDEYTPGASKKPAKKKPKKRKAADSDGSDEEWGKKKRKSTGKRGGTGFTRSFKLSPELAEVVGADVMPRHEVVKKVWEFIKSRKLQDPSQKQFAICDDTLMKVMGVKRFKTFGMMKYLKDHFVEAV